MLNNESVKYLNNETRPENLILDYKSQEIENKLRVETTRNIAGFEWMGGALYEYVKFNANTFNKIFSSAGPEDIVYFSEIDFHKYGLFLNGGKNF